MTPPTNPRKPLGLVDKLLQARADYRKWRDVAADSQLSPAAAQAALNAAVSSKAAATLYQKALLFEDPSHPLANNEAISGEDLRGDKPLELRATYPARTTKTESVSQPVVRQNRPRTAIASPWKEDGLTRSEAKLRKRAYKTFVAEQPAPSFKLPELSGGKHPEVLSPGSPSTPDTSEDLAWANPYVLGCAWSEWDADENKLSALPLARTGMDAQERNATERPPSNSAANKPIVDKALAMFAEVWAGLDVAIHLFVVFALVVKFGFIWTAWTLLEEIDGPSLPADAIAEALLLSPALAAFYWLGKRKRRNVNSK